MLTKTLIAAALAIPALALSSAAFAGQVYQGGPKSGISRNVQTVEINKPYAQLVPGTRVGTSTHVYQGGPKSTMPHGQR